MPPKAHRKLNYFKIRAHSYLEEGAVTGRNALLPTTAEDDVDNMKQKSRVLPPSLAPLKALFIFFGGTIV